MDVRAAYSIAKSSPFVPADTELLECKDIGTGFAFAFGRDNSDDSLSAALGTVYVEVDKEIGTVAIMPIPPIENLTRLSSGNLIDNSEVLEGAQITKARTFGEIYRR